MEKSSFLFIFLMVSFSSSFLLSTEELEKGQSNKEAMIIFKKFVTYFKKKYKSQDEFLYRFAIFQKTLKTLLDESKSFLSQIKFPKNSNSAKPIRIKSPEADGTYHTSLYSYADLSDDEFEKRFLIAPRFFENVPEHSNLEGLKKTKGEREIAEMIENGQVDPFVEMTKKVSMKNEEGQTLDDPFSLPKSRNSRLIAHKLRSIFKISKLVNPFEMQESDKKYLPKPAMDPSPKARLLQFIFRSNPIGGYYSSPVFPSFPVSVLSSVPSSPSFTVNYKAAPSINPPGGPPYTSETITINGLEYPTYISWINVLTPVKDQGKCNACYAFSGLGAVEAQYSAKSGIKESLSEQEIIDCSTENEGCVGGQPYLVYKYIMERGVSRTADYPFKGKKGVCERPTFGNFFQKVTGYLFVNKGVLAIMRALKFGPVTIIGYASVGLKFYYNGLYEGQGCKEGQTPNHSALVYGYNLRTDKPYFMVKNGWGSNWGEGGLFKLKIGELSEDNYNFCQYAETPFNTFVVVGK